jgi:hypothetical protein
MGLDHQRRGSLGIGAWSGRLDAHLREAQHAGAAGRAMTELGVVRRKVKRAETRRRRAASTYLPWDRVSAHALREDSVFAILRAGFLVGLVFGALVWMVGRNELVSLAVRTRPRIYGFNVLSQAMLRSLETPGRRQKPKSVGRPQNPRRRG